MNIENLLNNLLKALSIFQVNPANTPLKEEKAERMDIRNDVKRAKADNRIIKKEIKKLKLKERLNKFINKQTK